MAAPCVDCTLAAIMAADAVGYSSLVQRDEPSTLDQLKIHRKELVEPLRYRAWRACRQAG